MRSFDKAMQANGVPEKVTMDKSGANKAAIDEINGSGETPIIERPSLIDRIGSGAVVALGGGVMTREGVIFAWALWRREARAKEAKLTV